MSPTAQANTGMDDEKVVSEKGLPYRPSRRWNGLTTLQQQQPHPTKDARMHSQDQQQHGLEKYAVFSTR